MLMCCHLGHGGVEGAHLRTVVDPVWQASDHQVLKQARHKFHLIQQFPGCLFVPDKCARMTVSLPFV